MSPSKEATSAAGIVEAIAVPHPPLIVPTVGRGEEAQIQKTIDAYKEAAKRVADAKPDALVVTSPHAPLFRDGFFVSDADHVHGDMAQFRAPQTTVDFPGDPELARGIAQAMERSGVPVARESELTNAQHDLAVNETIDHGTFVPLFFLAQELADAPVVRVGLSGLSSAEHRHLGQIIARVAAEQGKRVAFVASGDLSHKLKADGPYGFNPAGPVFDQRIGQIFEAGDLDALFAMDEQLCDDAAECGLRSFQIMAGALEEQSHAQSGADFESELLSIEGPFGVGYAVATFRRGVREEAKHSFAYGSVEPAAEARHSLAYEDGGPAAEAKRSLACDDGEPAEEAKRSFAYGDEETEHGFAHEGVDPYVGLARASVEGYVRSGHPIARPDELPADMLDSRAGVFVSLHEGGQLRGCIGTIAATKDCLADEIIANGVAACSQDPRFDPVREEELDHLSYSVDVLGEAEPIQSAAQLDPEHYGVIVTQGWKRGLLLPNLEGVDTVEQQLAIAKQKAGISPYDDDVNLERFQVVRHDRGGEARA